MLLLCCYSFFKFPVQDIYIFPPYILNWVGRASVDGGQISCWPNLHHPHLSLSPSCKTHNILSTGPIYHVFFHLNPLGYYNILSSKLEAPTNILLALSIISIQIFYSIGKFLRVQYKLVLAYNVLTSLKIWSNKSSAPIDSSIVFCKTWPCSFGELQT